MVGKDSSLDDATLQKVAKKEVDLPKPKGKASANKNGPVISNGLGKVDKEVRDKAFEVLEEFGFDWTHIRRLSNSELIVFNYSLPPEKRT
jgi:hypothetical protein